MTAVDAVTGNPVESSSVEGAPARCPVAHTTPQVARVRSRPDQLVRTLLRIHERPSGVSVQGAHTAFQRSMAISALRCTLTYVVFPFLVPLIGLSAGVGPAVGVVIGVTAIGCDVFTIRRFFAVDHRYRWQFSILVATVALLLSVLLVQDIAQLT